jgi:hypothetical protein
MGIRSKIASKRLEIQSKKLIYQKEYTNRQQTIYVLIKHLHDREGWSYRKISK